MNKVSVHRAVARATGESVNRIQRMAFNFVVVPPFQPKSGRPISSKIACHSTLAGGTPRANLSLSAMR